MLNHAASHCLMEGIQMAGSKYGAIYLNKVDAFLEVCMRMVHSVCKLKTSELCLVFMKETPYHEKYPNLKGPY